MDDRNRSGEDGNPTPIPTPDPNADQGSMDGDGDTPNSDEAKTSEPEDRRQGG